VKDKRTIKPKKRTRVAQRKGEGNLGQRQKREFGRAPFRADLVKNANQKKKIIETGVVGADRTLLGGVMRRLWE